MRTILGVLVLCLLSGSVGFTAEVDNIEENIRRLGFDKYYSEIKKSQNRKKPVKVAIFDYGFDEYEKAVGYSIPQNTEYKQRPDDQNFRDPRDKNTHGLAMAEIITQYMTNDYNNWSLAPKIYLYKSDGYSNLQWAIDDAIQNGVDIILHSIVIEYGSNYDGRGFFNDLVNRATNAGIVWINAAGNFGLTTYNSNVDITESAWVDLGLKNNALPVKCEFPKEAKVKAQQKKCRIRVVLAWDDFKNTPEVGSDKDLDLYLFDNNFERKVTSELIQVRSEDSNAGSEGHTLYPREILETTIGEGVSFIKVKAKSDNFSTGDRLRITADGNNLKFPVRDKEESILNPADNPTVITVGEETTRSSVSKTLQKPEFIAPSLVKGDDGRQYKGSSNAAAVVAAGVALMKKINPNLDRDAILDLATRRNATVQDIMNYPVPVPVPTGPYPGPFPGVMSPMGPSGPVFFSPELNQPMFIQSSRPVKAQPKAKAKNQKPAKKPNAKSVQSDGMSQDEETADDEAAEYIEEDDQETQQANVQGPPPMTVAVPPVSLRTIPTQALGFAPRGPGCYPPVDVKMVEPCVVMDFIIKSQSILVATNVFDRRFNKFERFKIATSFDPILLIPGDARFNVDDKVAIFPTDGFPFRRVPRDFRLPPGAVEIFQMPVNEILCKIPDFNFLATEMEISRRQVYAAAQTGIRSRYVLQSCRVDVLASRRYPISDWSPYPPLQQAPYMAPVGPVPVDVRGASYSGPNGIQGPTSPMQNGMGPGMQSGPGAMTAPNAGGDRVGTRGGNRNNANVGSNRNSSSQYQRNSGNVSPNGIQNPATPGNYSLQQQGQQMYPGQQQQQMQQGQQMYPGQQQMPQGSSMYPGQQMQQNQSMMPGQQSSMYSGQQQMQGGQPSMYPGQYPQAGQPGMQGGQYPMQQQMMPGGQPMMPGQQPMQQQQQDGSNFQLPNPDDVRG